MKQKKKPATPRTVCNNAQLLSEREGKALHPAHPWVKQTAKHHHQEQCSKPLNQPN
jgi:hypothetical protein